MKTTLFSFFGIATLDDHFELFIKDDDEKQKKLSWFFT